MSRGQVNQLQIWVPFFVATLCNTALANPTLVVQAEVTWNGICDNRARLESELTKRGVELITSTREGNSTESLRLSVWASAAGDPAKARSIAATLELRDDVGGHVVRSIEARHCEELHTTVAVILAVFTRAQRERAPDQRAEEVPVIDANAKTAPEPLVAAEGPATNASATNAPAPHASATNASATNAPAPHASATNASATNAPAPHASATPAPEPVTATMPDRLAAPSHGAAAPRRRSIESATLDSSASAQPVGGELRLGTTWSIGLGWVGLAAMGPSMHFEWRPTKTSPLSLQLGMAELSTFEFRADDRAMTAKRRFGSAAAILDTPISVLRVAAGVEVGSVTATGLGLPNSRSDRATWFAFRLLPLIELPLVRRTLTARVGTGVGFTPLSYPFRYANTGNIATETSHFEWLTELGLSVQLSPSFP